MIEGGAKQLLSCSTPSIQFRADERAGPALFQLIFVPPKTSDLQKTETVVRQRNLYPDSS